MNIRETLRSAVRVAPGFVACVLVTHVLASGFQSLFVMAALEEIGAQFSAVTRLQVIAHDIVGLVIGGELSFGGMLLSGFLIALPLAALSVRFARIPAPIAYPLAGAVTLAAILQLIQIGFFYNMTFLEGTRGSWGYLSQLAAGAIGGFVFLLLASRARRP
jgi:hypothetical protein